MKTPSSRAGETGRDRARAIDGHERRGPELRRAPRRDEGARASL